MNLGLLVLVLFQKILLIKYSEFVSAKGFDLFLNYLIQVAKAFEIKQSSTITLTARKSFIVNLGSFALKTVNLFLNTFLVTVLTRNKNIALNFLSIHLDGLHLVATMNS